MNEPRQRRSVKGLLNSLTAVANECDEVLGASSSTVDNLRARATILSQLLKETQGKHDAAQSDLRIAQEQHNTRASRVALMRELIKLFNVEEQKGE